MHSVENNGYLERAARYSHQAGSTRDATLKNGT